MSNQVTAYKDDKGKLFDTQQEADASNVKDMLARADSRVYKQLMLKINGDSGDHYTTSWRMMDYDVKVTEYNVREVYNTLRRAYNG